MAAAQGFTSAVFSLSAFGMTYAALYSGAVNFMLAIGLTPLFNRPLQPTVRWALMVAGDKQLACA